MTDRLAACWNRQYIEEVAQKIKIRDPSLLEMHIVALAVLHQIRTELPDCALKGGMAVPFYLEEGKIYRLSMDMDVATGQTKEKVTKAMNKISDALEIPVKFVPYKPANPYKKLPLLTYTLTYDSVFGGTTDMKIEIFYGMNMDRSIKEIDDPGRIIDSTLDFSIVVYGRSMLIGDKLTTLAIGSIGVPPERKHDIPKQIYDIAGMLRSMPDDQIMDVIRALDESARMEISYVSENPPDIEKILYDLDHFSEALFEGGRIKLGKNYIGMLETFTTNLLGGGRYTKGAHIADILLIKAVIKLVMKSHGGTPEEIIVGECNKLLSGLKALSELDPDEKAVRFKTMLRRHERNSPVGKIIKNLSPDQAYLYDAMVRIDQL